MIRTSQSDPGELRPRSRLLAAGACLVLPGGGQFYARRPWTGLVLLLCFAGGVVMMLDRPLFYGGLTLLIGALATDLVAAQLAVGACNDGVERSRGRQLLVGLALGLGLVLVAMTVNRVVEPLLQDHRPASPPVELPAGEGGAAPNPFDQPREFPPVPAEDDRRR